MLSLIVFLLEIRVQQNNGPQDPSFTMQPPSINAYPSTSDVNYQYYSNYMSNHGGINSSTSNGTQNRIIVIQSQTASNIVNHQHQPSTSGVNYPFYSSNNPFNYAGENSSTANYTCNTFSTTYPRSENVGSSTNDVNYQYPCQDNSLNCVEINPSTTNERDSDTINISSDSDEDSNNADVSLVPQYLISFV